MLSPSLFHLKGIGKLTRVYFFCFREAFITPTYDIDLVWHSHQLCPASYKTDMLSVLGCMLNHDDTDQDRQPGSKLSTVSSPKSRAQNDSQRHLILKYGRFSAEILGSFCLVRWKILVQMRLNPLKDGHRRSTPSKQKFWGCFQNCLFGWSSYLWLVILDVNFAEMPVTGSLVFLTGLIFDQNNQDISFFLYFCLCFRLMCKHPSYMRGLTVRCTIDQDVCTEGYLPDTTLLMRARGRKWLYLQQTSLSYSIKCRYVHEPMSLILSTSLRYS